ncbi:uncharacterized protein LOC131956962 isoform X2 [Physella acuta]|uniref:uncharacterized protein LOC131956962 isoform X2 n=1 Tax=Physella acuta TaxID=109671 RepID=UPI0027DD2A54|nr:uncharacterized protein LOC131956962 isoform X2 [Physella acuta]
MSSYIRRQTYMLPESGPTSGIDQQNLMRLKVNKIALIQELSVEHVTGPLLAGGVLEEKDLNQIESHKTAQEKARTLVEILPTKDKHSEWYKTFRGALLNPESSPETKKRYKHLVDFLDNTVIHRPSSQAGRFRESRVPGLPHYPALPGIHQNREEKENSANRDGAPGWLVPNDSLQRPSNMTLVQGYFHQWLPTPDDFNSVIEISSTHLKKLAESILPEDKKLLENEKVVVKKLQRLEVIESASMRKLLPSGFELCMADVVQDILNEPDLYHLYMKYLATLEAADIRLVKDLLSSYQSVVLVLNSMTSANTITQITQTGLKLSKFLIACNRYDAADAVLVGAINFLKQSPSLENWIPRHQAYVNLMHARNMAYRLDQAQDAYFDAVQLQFQINMTSFGQTIVHEGALHTETSHMLLEYGSIVSAHGWARRALKEVDPEEPAAVVRALCVAVDSYCAQWLVKKAELIAVYLVQYARYNFGERHPLFIEALLHFCHFNNECKQDEAGVNAAQDVLEAAWKTYGCECLHVALGHRAYSQALMCRHQFDTEDYYTHAIEAVRIARSVLGQHSPQLHLFLHTLASALQWKSLHCPKEMFDSTLLWAEAEAKQGLALVTAAFGEISLKSAQFLLLLGQIYSKMNRLELSANSMTQAVDYLKLCQPASSHDLLMGMASLGTFYQVTQKPELAVPRLKYVVEHSESIRWYQNWLHESFQSLLSLYRASGEDKDADLVQVKLGQWLKLHPKNNEKMDYSVLQIKPTSFQLFLSKADIWGSVFQKAMSLPAQVTSPNNVTYL